MFNIIEVTTAPASSALHYVHRTRHGLQTTYDISHVSAIAHSKQSKGRNGFLRKLAKFDPSMNECQILDSRLNTNYLPPAGFLRALRLLSGKGI